MHILLIYITSKGKLDLFIYILIYLQKKYPKDFKSLQSKGEKMLLKVNHFVFWFTSIFLHIFLPMHLSNDIFIL